MHFKAALVALVAASVAHAIDTSDSTDPSKLSIIENNIGPQITTTRPLHTQRHPLLYGDLDRTYYPNSGRQIMYRRSDDAASESGQSKIAVPGSESDENEDDKFWMFPYYGYRFYRPFYYRRTYPIFF
ncbi:hypothetical protein EMPS_00776 [Entomortierella parvispora]|uniref:Mating factor alpha n=1 Tax=Entomortierella parvispora TaxID=205924 RepID=A0A9P3H1L6_9FUNG|nr:hypothetical protein EMPS_00776 [Entomortierella parvispora]